MYFFPLLQGSSLLLWLLQAGFFSHWLKWVKNWSNWGILLPCAKGFIVTKWDGAPGCGTVSLSRDHSIHPSWVFYHPWGCFITSTLNSPTAGNSCLKFWPLRYYWFLFVIIFLFLDFHDPSRSGDSLILRFCPLSFPQMVKRVKWFHAGHIKALPRLGLISLCVPRFVTNISHSSWFPTWASPAFLPELNFHGFFFPGCFILNFVHISWLPFTSPSYLCNY